MWYALIDGRSSCVAMTHLAWGTLKDIANDLINECDLLIETMTEGMDKKKLRKNMVMKSQSTEDLQIAKIMMNQ